VRVRFRWGADGDNLPGAFDGWAVDDVQITALWPPSKAKLYLPLVARAYRP
jgi:hypothetical protein